MNYQQSIEVPTKQTATKGIKIIQTRGMYTTVNGVDVPIYCVIHEASNIPDAADWLAKYTCWDAETVENGGFIFHDED